MPTPDFWWALSLSAAILTVALIVIHRCKR